MTTARRPLSSPQILVLTQYYAPEPNIITSALAEHLAQGASVTVLASHPNFPTGKFAAGFKYWRPERRYENGVIVWRLPVVPDRSKSHLRRAISYLSFAVGAAIAAPLLAPRARLVWVYQTPFSTGLASLFHKYVLRARVVFAAVDLWPETFTAVGVSKQSFLLRLSFAYRRWINRRADLIVCSTKGTLQAYATDGIPVAKLAHIPIWVEGIPAQLPTVTKSRKRRIVYAGNIGWAQALDTVIHAAAFVKTDDPDLRFEFYGVGSALDHMRSLAQALGATNVTFCGWRAPDEMFSIVATSIAQIVSLSKEPLLRMTLPSKLPFAFATGTVILAGLEGEAAAVAADSGGAVLYDATSAESLVAAIQAVLRMTDDERVEMGERLQSAYTTVFQKDSLLSAYTRLILPSMVAEGEHE